MAEPALLVTATDALQKGKGCPLCSQEGQRIQSTDDGRPRYRCANCEIDYVSVRRPKLAVEATRPVARSMGAMIFEDLDTGAMVEVIGV